MPKVRGKLTKERTLQKLVKEVDILQLLGGCRNIIQLEGTFETDEHVLLVTEFCGGGDLQKLSDVSHALGIWSPFLRCMGCAWCPIKSAMGRNVGVVGRQSNDIVSQATAFCVMHCCETSDDQW